MNDALPERWQQLTLADVLDTLPSGTQVQQGWSPQCDKAAAQAHEWGVLKTTAIQAGSFLPEHNKRLPIHLRPREALEVRVGDLLLTNAGPRRRCAVPCLVRQTRPRLMLSGKFYRFRSQRDLLDPRFLELYLLSPEAQAALDAMKTGISDSGLNLTRGRFLALALPVPPLDQQRRIVEILEDHLSRLDAVRSALAVVQRRCDAWLDALVDRAVAGSWPEQRVSEIAAVGSGATPLRSRADYYENGTVPWVTSGALNGPFVTSPTSYITEMALRETAVKVWPVGTLLVAMYGEGRTRGRCSELAIASTTNQACAAIVVHPEHQALRSWLKLVLRSRYQRMRRMASGGVQPNLSLGLIKAMSVPLPPDEVRDEAIETMRCADQARARLRPAMSTALNDEQGLRRALFAAAFSGRLTGPDTDNKAVAELADV